MMLANLERLPVKTKEELGTLLLEKIRKGNLKPQLLWALGGSAPESHSMVLSIGSSPVMRPISG